MKKFLLIMSVLLLFGIGCSQQADQKMYTYKNFSFQYPADWTLEERGSSVYLMDNENRQLDIIDGDYDIVGYKAEISEKFLSKNNFSFSLHYFVPEKDNDLENMIIVDNSDLDIMGDIIYSYEKTDTKAVDQLKAILDSFKKL